MELVLLNDHKQVSQETQDNPVLQVSVVCLDNLDPLDHVVSPVPADPRENRDKPAKR